MVLYRSYAAKIDEYCDLSSFFQTRGNQTRTRIPHTRISYIYIYKYIVSPIPKIHGYIFWSEVALCTCVLNCADFNSKNSYGYVYYKTNMLNTKNKWLTQYLRSRGIVKKFQRLMNFVYIHIQTYYVLYMRTSHIRIIVIVIDNSKLHIIYRSRIHKTLCDVYNKLWACSHGR